MTNSARFWLYHHLAERAAAAASGQRVRSENGVAQVVLPVRADTAYAARYLVDPRYYAVGYDDEEDLADDEGDDAGAEELDEDEGDELDEYDSDDGTMAESADPAAPYASMPVAKRLQQLAALRDSRALAEGVYRLYSEDMGSDDDVDGSPDQELGPFKSYVEVHGHLQKLQQRAAERVRIRKGLLAPRVVGYRITRQEAWRVAEPHSQPPGT